MKVVLPTQILIAILSVATFWLLPVCEQACQLSAQERYQYRPAVGKTHFDFTLPSVEDGKQVCLSDFRGKKLLLFHFASW